MSLNFRIAGSTPYTPPSLPSTLESFIGHFPASLNMLPGFLHDGTTQYGVSQDFTQWDSNSGLTITPGQPSLDGQNSCQKLIATAVSGNHQAESNVRAPSVPSTPHQFRFAIVAKPSGYTRLVLSFISFASGGGSGTVGFDFAGGNTNYGNTFSGATLVGGAAHMTALTGGWYLGYFDFFQSGSYTGSDGPMTTEIFLDNGTGTNANSTSFTGDGTSGVLVLLCSLLPTVLWTQTWNQTYNQDFNAPIGTIVDLNNTKAPGFDFYTNNVFPQTVYTTFGWSPTYMGSGVSPTPASSVTQPARSIMRIWNPNTVTGANAGFTAQLMSIVDDGAGGYHGSVFTGPMISDQLAAFSGTNVVTGGSSLPAALKPVQIQFSPYITGDGSGWYTMPLGAVISTSNAANKLNPLNLYMIDEFDMGGSFTQHGDMGQQIQILGHWNPSSPVGNQVVTDAGTWNAQTPDQYVRGTAVWIPCYCDSNALGWGLVLNFGNGGMGNGWQLGGGQFFVAAYPRSNRIGQSDFQTVFTIPQANDKGTVVVPSSDPPPGTIPAGGQQFNVDWLRIWNTTQTSLNFWDPFDADSNLVFDNTSLIVTKTTGSGWGSVRASGIGKNSGKWYWEITLTGGTLAVTTSAMLGLMNRTATVSGDYPGQTSKGAGLQYNTASNTNVSGVTGNVGNSITWTTGDVIGFAFDAGNGKVWIHKNGTYLASMNPDTSTGIWSGFSNSDFWYPAVAIDTSGVGTTLTANFGETAFAFTQPSGYSKWSLP